MAKIMTKKLLVTFYVCAAISVLIEVYEMIADFQRGKNLETFEGWGDVLAILFWIALAIFVSVKYHKDKEKGEDNE